MSRIPKLLHYCWFSMDHAAVPLGLLHYVCIRSAVERIRPDVTYFYYDREPVGPWWNLIAPLVQPVKITPPQQIFGRPLAHPAHRADVVRLQKLIEHGGIYLDVDVFVHRSFDDLLNNSFAIGQEGINGEIGLANAVLLAEPGAPFLQRWLEEYRWFRSKGRDEFWNEHSVRLPRQLAQQHPEEVTVLPHWAFHWPIGTNVAWLFEPGQPALPKNAYANHLWETVAWEKYVENLTVRRVRQEHGPFYEWAKPLLADLPDDFAEPSALGKFLIEARKLKRTLRRSVGKVRRKLLQSTGHTLTLGVKR